MAKLTAVLGDITTMNVDAIVNAANSRMRGGGGVSGAIHKAAGPGMLQECIDKFPMGLETGLAGWTSGGDLPAKYVIHTPGPNYRAGQQDVALLIASYRNSLAVADELQVKSLAYPLLSAGIYGWPLEEAIHAPVKFLSNALANAQTSVEEITFVALDQAIVQQIAQAIENV